jgi:hypothetical protein
MNNLPFFETAIVLTTVWVSVWRVSSYYFTGRLPTFLAWTATLLVRTML